MSSCSDPVTDHAIVSNATLEHFFEEYAKAFRALDAEAIANFYFDTVVELTRAGMGVTTSRDAVIENFKIVVSEFRAMGLNSIQMQLESTSVLSDFVGQVHVHWRARGSSTETVTLNNIYTVRSVGRDLKICGVFLLGSPPEPSTTSLE